MTKTVKRWTADQWEAIAGNGCTGIPDLYLETACQRHDRHYETHQHRDGRPITRFEADVELAKDSWKALPVFPAGAWTFRNFMPRILMAPVRLAVKTVVPPVVFAGVRIGGASHWAE